MTNKTTKNELKATLNKICKPLKLSIIIITVNINKMFAITKVKQPTFLVLVPEA